MAFPWVVQQIKDILSKLVNKADINSPVFMGIPQAPTVIINTNSDQLATTAFAHAMENARYGTCVTAAATVAKIGDIDNFVRKTGSIIGLKFTYANSASNPTLNVNNTGAAYIYHQGTYITANMLPANHTALFQFNGVQWELINPAGSGESSARIVITSSGTWIAPKDGVYTFVLIGGGGGGGGGGANATYGAWGGPGGGGGGVTYTVKLTAGASLAIIVGAGGAGGAGVITGTGTGGIGLGGGETSISSANLTIVLTAGGGGGGGGGAALNTTDAFYSNSGGGGGGGGYRTKGGDGGAATSSASGTGGSNTHYVVAASSGTPGTISAADTNYTRRVVLGGGTGGVPFTSTSDAFDRANGSMGINSFGGTQVRTKTATLVTYPVETQSAPGDCLLASWLGNTNYGRGGAGGVGKLSTALAASAGIAGTAGAVGIFY